MKLIKVENERYTYYETLLMKRNELEKEAQHIYYEYIRKFGDILCENFKLKIECIALKKSIAYCVMKQNKGEPILKYQMHQYVQLRMEHYYEELEQMQLQNDASKKASPISTFEAKEIKRIFRKLAKQMHPDLTDVAHRYPEIMELFQQVLTAYKCNDYQAIKELEVLCQSALQRLGVQTYHVEIEDIDAKIENLEQEIDQIVSELPYTYKYLLDDEDACEDKLQSLKQEQETYLQYRSDLQKQLDTWKDDIYDQTSSWLS